MQFDSQITGIREACTCDGSASMFAVSFEGRVVLVRSGDSVARVAEVPFASPVADIFGVDWNFVLAVGEGTALRLVTLGEDGSAVRECAVELGAPARAVAFITAKHVAVLVDGGVAVVHVAGSQCGRVELSDARCSAICGAGEQLFAAPYYCCAFQSWRRHVVRKLKSDGHREAIQELLLLYENRVVEFDTEGSRDEIREFMKEMLGKYLVTVREPLDMLFAAKAAVKVELGEYMIGTLMKQMSDKSKEQVMIVAMMEAAADKPELTPSVVRMLPKIKNVDKGALEEVLLRMTFPNSFIQELISISKENCFYRLLFQNFNRIYENIFPVFSMIVDTGNQEEIAFALKYVFLDGNFEDVKTNICVVWMFSPDYSRLHKCFEADWSIAADLIRKILDMVPIKFSPTQSLNRKEIVSVSFICFEGAPLEKADNLFALLASEALENDIVIPYASINTVLSFIFKSSAPRTIREKLLLKIVDNDFKGQISLAQHSGLCIASGFSNIVKQIFAQSNDIEPYLTSILLSDQPNMAFSVIEDKTISRDSIKYAISMRFLPLLLLDSDRFVNLIITRFPELHPSYIDSIETPNIKMLYYESLFSNCNYTDSSDYKYYLKYLATHSITKFITFLRKGKHIISEEELFEYCKENNLFIGSAVLYSQIEKWDDVYKSYLSHIKNEGKYDPGISIDIITNIKKINDEPSQVLRSILQPIVEISEDASKLVNTIITKAYQNITQFEVLLGILPPAVCCSNHRIKSVLFKYINKTAFCCSLESKSGQNFIPKLNEIIKYCKEKCISNDKITLYDGKDGLTVLSTLQERKGEPMCDELSSDAISILQRVESIFVSHGKRVSQDEESNVVLILNN